MRSRPARLTLSALAWITLGAAAFLTFQQQQQIDSRRAAFRAFASTARDAADALDDVQASLQAYVAAGQDAAEWIPKVTTYLQTASSSIDTLRSTALSGGAGPSLLDASTAMTEMGNIDRAVRQHLGAGETSAAAAAIFGEAADAISSAVSNVDASVTSEQQAADAFESAHRQAQVYVLAGAGGLAAIVLALLGFASPRSAADPPASTEEASGPSAFADAPAAPASGPASSAASGPAAPSLSDSAVRTLAGICTEFTRVRQADQINALLEQAASLMNARGLIVWLGDTSGSDLRPVLAHGYSAATLAHIPSVAVSADNAAAAAYRTGEIQIVKSRPGGGQGAVVAPLLAADGCIGALTAEIRDGGEQAETTRGVATILAAQLAGVLASAAEPAKAAPSESQTATA